MSTFRLFKVAVLFAAAMYFEGCGKKDDSKPNAASPTPDAGDAAAATTNAQPAAAEDEQSGDVPESSPGTGTEFGDGSTAVAGSPVVPVNKDSISGGAAINDVCIQLRLYNLFLDWKH